MNEKPVLAHLFALPPLAVIIVVGFLDFRRVSSSAELKSFFAQHVHRDAPESTSNSRSSGFLAEGAGITHASVEESNVALSFVLSLKTFFAKPHASLRAHLSCCKAS